MAKFGKTPQGPMLDTGEGAPTLGKSAAKSISSDGTTRGKGKKGAPKTRALFGALGGGAKLKGSKTAKAANPDKAASRIGYGGMMGAGDMAADTKKYGAMMKGKGGK